MSNMFAKFSLLLLSPRCYTFLSYTGKKPHLRISCRNSVVDVSFGSGHHMVFLITIIKEKEVMNLREKEKGDGGKKENWENYGIFILFPNKNYYMKKEPTSQFAFRQLLSFCSFVLFLLYF